MAAYVFGLATFGEGVYGGWKDSNLNSFIGAMVTPLLVALVPNYLGSVLRELDAARQDAVDALGDSELLYRVARAFLEGGRRLDDVLPHVAAAALEASRFDARAAARSRTMLDAAARRTPTALDVHGVPPSRPRSPRRSTRDGARTYAASSLPAPLDAAFAGCAWAGVVPLRSADAVEGLARRRHARAPGAILHEVRLLDAVAGQIALGVRNIRLTDAHRRAGGGGRARRASRARSTTASRRWSTCCRSAWRRRSTASAATRTSSGSVCKDLTALAKNALWEVRQYIFDLRPLLSGDEGLVGAVQGQVKEFQAVADMPVELTVTGAPARLPIETSAALYRIVQEGLGNIFRHARASQRARSRSRSRTAPCGSPSRTTASASARRSRAARVGYGMGNLRQRVEDLHGTLDVRSEPGAGTRIEVAVPIGGDE